jgi:hypothetical protein
VSPRPSRDGSAGPRRDGGGATAAPDGDARSDRLEEFRHPPREALSRRLGVDTRGLAALRVSLGLLVVADLLFRGRELTTFYTDSGVLPRAALAEVSPMLARYSLHTLTGSTAGQAALFLLGGCLAVAMTVGYRTRLATAGVVGMHASLYARNPSVMNGGDGLLVLALFLGLFVPLGERWSVDALRSGRDRRQWVASLATATLLAQLVVVYLANVAFKHQSDPWRDGVAVQYVLELEQFSIGLGPYLTAYPELLAAVNWLWMGLLVVSPLLLVTTGWRRTLVVSGYVLAHLGMLVTMRLGLFPLVVVALLLVYLPPSVWERAERRLDERDLREWSRRALASRLPSAHRETEVPTAIRRAGRLGATVFLAVFLVVSVAWPVTAVGVVDPAGHDAVPDPDGYTWTLFAPNPPTSTRWFVAPATLDSGERVDAIDGSSADFDPPADAADAYPSTLWHRYLSDMRWASRTEREYLASYLCRRAGRYGDGAAVNVSLYAFERTVPSAGGGDVERTELIRYDCSNAPGA